jgi:hypothetical protein
MVGAFLYLARKSLLVPNPSEMGSRLTGIFQQADEMSYKLWRQRSGLTVKGRAAMKGRFNANSPYTEAHERLSKSLMAIMMAWIDSQSCS